jgi:HK97 family phage major capsid protein
MNMSLIQLREEQVEAESAFSKITEEIKNADASADLDALQESFDKAEARYTTACNEYKAEVERQDRARAKFELDQAASDAEKRFGAVPTPDVRVKSEPLTYSQMSPHGFFRDLARSTFSNDTDAAERIARHKREMAVERYDLNSTDASGGYLVPPAWLNEQFVDLAAAGRVVANTIGTRPLPGNTDSISLPTLSTATSAATQTADGTAVSETDAAFSVVTGVVKTVAGMQDVSQQLVDRSIPGVDQVIFQDLLKQYAITLDTAVINSSTTSNLGLLQLSGTNGVTYTTSTPTVAGIYPKIASAIQQIHTGVYMPANAIFMHPRRWAWFLSSLDDQSRPLITPYAPQNAAGDHGGVVAEGLVGSIQGVNVYVDANIPTTLGASTTEDAIIVCRTDELFVYEEQAGPYLETFRDVGSGTLTVRFRLHNYWGQILGRRPTAISKITGTGVIAPTF